MKDEVWFAFPLLQESSQVAMAFLRNLLGGFSYICEGELDFGSSCVQRSIIDVVNLLFLCGFYLLLLVVALRKHPRSQNSGRDWVSVVASICCTFISFACLGTGLWDLIAKIDTCKNFSWLVYLVRGLIWTSLTVSLLVQKSKWIKILSSIWWVSFSLLVSALFIENLSKTNSIQILEILPLPVNMLLLLCAMRNFIHLAKNHTDDKSLCKPLLVDEVENKPVESSQATVVRKLTFSWVNALLSLGYSKPLFLNDIPPLNIEDESDFAYQKFADAWESLLREKVSNETNNLVLKAIARVYLKEHIFVAICAFLRNIAVVTLPVLLYGFINYSNHGGENLHGGLFLLGCLILCKVVESLSQRHWFFNSRRSGMRMRSALMAAIYQKQLKLSSLGRRKHSTGEIVNYISVDAYRMGEFPWWLHLTWSLSLQLFLSIGVLFFVVGFGAILGLVPILICGYLNVPFARSIQRCQSEFMVEQDKRLRATSEILNSMKIIKLQSWEEKFKNLIESLREDEFKWLAEQQFKKPHANFLYWVSPTVISSVIFLGCVLFRSAPLNASTIFTVLAALRGMSEPVRMIPDALSIMIQVKVSFDRINKFLLDHELESTEIRKNSSTNFNTSVEIHAANFSWDPEIPNPTIRDVTLEVQKGQKIAICGPVGAGKSSLLHAVLGEMPKVSGDVHISGSIAFVSQTSWIQSGTIRENILYGRPMDIGRYEKVIKACALDKDIKNFPHGDLTEIGQRGTNMSGGQKQRIQLARAVYNDAEIYLLDDPFSAVDAHTASLLFKDCVTTALKTKTVILVSHQVEFLSEIDKVLVMEDGKITQSGSYQDLLVAGTAFEKLVNAQKDVVTGLGTSYSGSPGEPQKVDVDQLEDSNGFHHNEQKSGGQLTEEEEKETGDVGWKPFQDYIHISKGFLLLLLSILTQSAFIILQAAATYWLAFAIEIPNVTSGMLIGVFAGISIFSTTFIYLRSMLTVLFGLKASKAFFSGFTNAIFKAPMFFFDSTPVGRILTRASSDLSILDFDIPFAYNYVLTAATELLVTIGIVAFVTWPVLIPAILTMAAIRYIQDYYLATARELIRINGTTKAPVMNYAAETSLGIVTIRASNMGDRFFRNYLKLVDMDAKLFFFSNATIEWVVLRIETLQNLTLFTAAFLIVLLPKGRIAPGLVGLSLSYALNLSGTQIYLSRWYCNLSNYMISVERIKQFMNIPPEPPAIVEDMRPPSSWPSKGRIELHELKIRYRPNAPLVLKGITCTFEEGTRVGVVGRTGSGKTTLISALFRLVEPASGKVLIDGLDISAMGLKDLRTKLSIIPQEATLFRGRVRTNLDPLGLYSDDAIWKALEKCQMKETINSLPNKLEATVSDEGDNWSAGQRQLFCLGRVLLKRNRILVLDEATASMDSATDAIIQRIIREEFSDCTVITVAHRVPTVIDSDRVMVLSYGNLVEYDDPSKLMATNSSFAKLVAEYWSSFRRNSYES